MKKRIVSIIIICVCGVLIGSKIYKTNQAVKDVPEKIYEMGEMVPFEKDLFYIDSMEGYSMEVLSAEIKTTEDFLKEYHASANAIPEGDYSPKICDIEVKIKNENEKDNAETGIDLREMKLQSGASIAGFSDIYYRVANESQGITDTRIALRAQSEYTLHLVFNFPEDTFSTRAYNQVESFDWKLVMTLYPTKKMIRLT